MPDPGPGAVQQRRPYFGIAPTLTTINQRDGDGKIVVRRAATGNWVDGSCADVGTPKTVDQWFDTSCFANPAQYAFGNYQIGDVRGPSAFNTDFSAFKKTRIGSSAFELRIDVFNVFNRAHFANPGTTFGNSTFGRIAATRLTPREVQVGFRFLF